MQDTDILLLVPFFVTKSNLVMNHDSIRANMITKRGEWLQQLFPQIQWNQIQDNCTVFSNGPCWFVTLTSRPMLCKSSDSSSRLDAWVCPYIWNDLAYAICWQQLWPQHKISITLINDWFTLNRKKGIDYDYVFIGWQFPSQKAGYKGISLKS